MGYAIKLQVGVQARTIKQAIAKVTTALEEIAEYHDILSTQEIIDEEPVEDDRVHVSWEYNNFPGFNL